MTVGVCPYCRAPIALQNAHEDAPQDGHEDPAESTPQEALTTCAGCGTLHHADCYSENGGCTIFGCSCAPAEEPKLSVSGPDLQAVETSAPAPPAEPIRNSTPPPPRDPSAPPPPSPDTGAVPQVTSSNSLHPQSFSTLGLSSPGTYSGGAIIPEPVSSFPPKSRTTYIVLGALLGAVGAHSFYAGYKTRGGIQLAITLLTLGFGSPMSWIWAIIDICTVGKDSRGIQFES